MENYLEKKKVNVKIIEKTRSGFLKISDGNTIYTGCKQVFQAPTNQYDRLIPILTEEEQRWFEEKMGLSRNDLSFNNKDKSFWKDFKVTLDKKGKVLDLEVYEDFLALRVLKASNAVANSKDEVNVLQHTFYIENAEEEAEENAKQSDRYEEASKLFGKINKSDKKMIDVLRLLGITVPIEANTKWLKSRLVKVIEQKAKIGNEPNVDEFIKIASDPEFDVKIFILDAVELGEIYIDGTTYKLRSGDTIGFDLGQAISFFNNPKNQGTRILIEERVKVNKA